MFRSAGDAVKRDHFSVMAGLLAAIPCPVTHEATALLEQVAPAVSGLNLVADNMRERGLDDVVLIIGRLGSPVAEGRSEAVRDKARPHATHELEHGHVGERPVRAGTDENKAVAVTLLRQGVEYCDRALTERDAMLLLAFMRSAGMVHTRASVSTSDHRAPSASPVRTAVRIVSSSARAEMPSRVRSSAMNAGISA